MTSDDDAPPRGAVVLRFPPGGDVPPRRLRQEARWNHKRHAEELDVDLAIAEPWFRLSVFAAVPAPGESEAQVLRRLIKVATSEGIHVDDPRNSRFWVSRSDKIVDAGFSFRKDAYPGEAPEHYSVDIGPDEPSNERVTTFVACFEGPNATQEVRPD